MKAGASPSRIVFLDFEASSLGKHGFPIEVAWVFETGDAEAYLIHPAEGWTDWDPDAEAVHRIPRALLEREGRPVAEVARRMVAVLTGHRLFASAPSWDGHWLSLLLRAGGLPRHALRLRDTEEIQAETARAALAAGAMPDAQAQVVLARLLDEARRSAKAADPAHRALADAQRELAQWREIRRRAEHAVRYAPEQGLPAAAAQPGSTMKN